MPCPASTSAVTSSATSAGPDLADRPVAEQRQHPVLALSAAARVCSLRTSTREACQSAATSRSSGAAPVRRRGTVKSGYTHRSEFPSHPVPPNLHHLTSSFGTPRRTEERSTRPSSPGTSRVYLMPSFTGRRCDPGVSHRMSRPRLRPQLAPRAVICTSSPSRRTTGGLPMKNPFEASPLIAAVLTEIQPLLPRHSSTLGRQSMQETAVGFPFGLSASAPHAARQSSCSVHSSSRFVSRSRLPRGGAAPGS